MRRIARLIVWGSLAALPFGSVDADNQLFSLTLAGPKEPLKSGAELRLRVTVKNTSERKIAFIRSPGVIPEEGFRYTIDVRDADSKNAAPSQYVRELTNKTTVTFESRYAQWLEPGESFIDEVTVTKFFDLSQPGKYTIWVARELPPRQNLGEGKVKSNSVVVVVTK